MTHNQFITLAIGIAPILLNLILLFLLIKNWREQLRYEAKFKERMSEIKNILEDIKKQSKSATPTITYQ